MSNDQPPVYFAEADDAEMLVAMESARRTFKYFWRELSWEQRRIVPGCEVAAVKGPFSDAGRGPGAADDDVIEHMWFSDIVFDGHTVRGFLLNTPGELRTYHAGDPVQVPLTRVGDWMYAQLGRVYGAHTVNLLRARMHPEERLAHDAAWGLDFGDPETIELVPPPRDERGVFARLLKRGHAPVADPDAEHPMCVNVAPRFEVELRGAPGEVERTDARGWTPLHRDALAGNTPIVEMLLRLGADKRVKNAAGETAADLAALLGWDRCVALLS